MPKPAFLILDTKDDRREVHRLLTLLSPDAAIAWLQWCCKQVFLPGSRINPTPSVRGLGGNDRMSPAIAAARRDNDAHYRLATEILFDWYKLLNCYGLDAQASAKELERRAKAKR